MNEIKVIGIDLAKNVFQLHAADERGKVVWRKRVSRSELLALIAQLKPCIIGIEACGGSNYWAREFIKLGHQVRQIAPQFVVPFRKNDKNDRNDAEAIYEAVIRPAMRFVPIKKTEHQDVQSLHRIRTRLVGNRTATGNEIRGLLFEYGIVIPLKLSKLKKALPVIAEDETNQLSNEMRGMVSRLYEEILSTDKEIKFYEEKIELIFERESICKKLIEIEGVGMLTATAVFSSLSDPNAFKNGRQYSASLGLVPKQNSSGNKERLLSITKRGDVYLRTLLIHGSRAYLRFASRRTDKKSIWAMEKVQKRGFNRAAVAVASKNARTIWAMMKNNTDYHVAA